MEESIIEVLKYSQKDMDAVIAKVRAEEVCLSGLTELQSLVLLKSYYNSNHNFKMKTLLPK